MPETRLEKTQRVVRVHPDHPDPDLIHQAGKRINNQGVVIFPTQCLYGLAADALDPSAVNAIFSIKLRPKNNPLLVLIRSHTDLEKIAANIPDQANILMKTFWPGSLTLVFEAKPGICELLTAGTGKIGVRITSHPVARALVQAAGRPITGTSANVSGSPGCSRISDMPQKLIQAADMVLDAGPLKGGTGSTVLDITCNPPLVLRQGAVSADKIRQVLASHQKPAICCQDRQIPAEPKKTY